MTRRGLALVALLAPVGCGEPGDVDTAAPVVDDTAADTDTDTDTDSDTDTADDTAVTHPYDSAPQPSVLVDGVAAPRLVAGQDVLFFVNGRLSDANTGYATNRIEQSRLLGPDCFVYDPAQPGTLLGLGRPDYGDVAGYQGRERQKLTVDEVAWHPDHGLYTIQIDPTNDEWLLGKWAVADWTTPDQRWATELWGVPVDDDEQHSLYWEYGIDALEFLDGRLYAGSHADYTRDDGGELYAFDMALPPTYDPSQPESDRFYMAEAPTAALLALPYGLQFAGDLASTPVGPVATIGASDPAVLSDDVNALYGLDLTAMTYTSTESVIQLSADDQDVEGLATVNGVLYGITVDARVLRIDPATGAATLHDDLGPLFRDRDAQVRVRGATTVSLP